MLLTSSQVSVAVTSGVIILCTFALFLSGYAIQQRTLRDLRAAIRQPKPSPKIFLPDRFKAQTTELEDGTIIVLDGGDELDQQDDFSAVAADDAGVPSVQEVQEGADQQVLVEVKPSVQGVEDAEADAAALPGSAPEVAGADGKQKPVAQQAAAEELPTKTSGNGKKRNKKKKAQATDKSDQPVSRAERRRRIREQIRNEHDKPIYYKRRTPN